MRLILRVAGTWLLGLAFVLLIIDGTRGVVIVDPDELVRSTAIAASDLQEVEATVPRYFDANSRKTQLLRSMLVDVAKQSTQTTVPRPDDTFAALAAVSAGR